MTFNRHSDVHYDYIVVGGGSAGAIVASRLSEDNDCQVLLLEAGIDYADLQKMPDELLDANKPVMSGHNWIFEASIKQTAASTFDYIPGKVMGGTSTINGALALRGIPEDYTEWMNSIDNISAARWSWSAVKERFADMEAHIPIVRESPQQLTRLQSAFRSACLQASFPEVADHNLADSSGVGILPKNIAAGKRMSSALSYLSVARERPNLTIIDRARAVKLLWQQDRAIVAGVSVERQARAGQKTIAEFFASRVILCAGVINTPSLMMHSGLGDPQALRALGIPITVPLTGVGRHLIDHPVVGIWAVPKPGATHLQEPNHQMVLRYTTEGSVDRNDMHVYMLSGVDTTSIPQLQTALGSTIGVALSACLMKSRSSGAVTLRSSNPNIAPAINFNCLAEPQDKTRIKAGVKLAWALLKSPQINEQLARVLAWTDGLVASEQALEHAVTTFVRPCWHAVGTAKMGNKPEAGAVVDGCGKVFGVDNLWVADASIMPSIPSAPTYLSTAMVAETIVAGLREHA